jgi:hypothetical protein
MRIFQGLPGYDGRPGPPGDTGSPGDPVSNHQCSVDQFLAWDLVGGGGAEGCGSFSSSWLFY